MAKIHLDWKPTSDFDTNSPKRMIFVYQVGALVPLLWTHVPGDPGPHVAGHDWWAEFEGFELPEEKP
jgi:hypothetical protein